MVSLSAGIGTYDVTLPLIILLGLTFLTDLLDGFVSRRFKQITEIGKMLDSSSDYTLLFSVTLILFLHGILSPVLFWTISARLVLQGAGMFILKRKTSKFPPQTTQTGKITIAAIMLLVLFKLGKLLFPGIPESAYMIAETVMLIFLAWSIIDKIIFFYRLKRIKS
jgi:phosphatidylglycerophosphate synthase